MFVTPVVFGVCLLIAAACDLVGPADYGIPFVEDEEGYDELYPQDYNYKDFRS